MSILTLCSTYTLYTCYFASVFTCSGRMRQNGSAGVAIIRALVDGAKIAELVNPYPRLNSWQWVDRREKESGSNLTIVLTVNNSDSLSGTAYFDDLCVTFSPIGSEGVFVDVTKCAVTLIKFAVRLASNHLMH